jgi:hypothetical protein
VSEKSEKQLNLVMAALGVVLKNQSIMLATLAAMSDHDGVTKALMQDAERSMKNAEKMMEASQLSEAEDMVMQ